MDSKSIQRRSHVQYGVLLFPQKVFSFRVKTSHIKSELNLILSIVVVSMADAEPSKEDIFTQNPDIQKLRKLLASHSSEGWDVAWYITFYIEIVV